MLEFAPARIIPPRAEPTYHDPGLWLEVAPLALRIPHRPLAALSEEEVERVHRASLRVLSRTGVEVLDAESLSLLDEAGAEVDWPARRVRLPDGLVERLLAQAPPTFTLSGRNVERDFVVGGEQLVLIPTGGPTMVSDLVRGRLPGTHAEQVNFIKLGQHSKLLDSAYRCVEAHDLPPAHRHVEFLSAVTKYSDKPLVVPTIDVEGAFDNLAVAALVRGGVESLRRRPGVMTIVNVDSPLRLGTTAAKTIVAFARAGQPVQITPFILPGVMSPVTPAGSLVQQNAENLAAIALAQAAAQGAPVVYGSFATQTDMRTASPVFGGGESVLLEVAAGQLARRYNLPHRGMGLVTTAHVADASAAWEKMNCLWGLALSNTHVIFHAAGWLEGGLTASYEQFVFDLEMLANLGAYAAGLVLDDASLALDTIAEVGPGGNYMLADHTLANFRLASFFSSLVDSRSYDSRLSNGGQTLLERAHTTWNCWLAEYEEPPIDPGVYEAVRDYVTRRERGEASRAVVN